MITYRIRHQHVTVISKPKNNSKSRSKQHRMEKPYAVYSNDYHDRLGKISVNQSLSKRKTTRLGNQAIVWFWCKSLQSNGGRGINAFCNIFSLTAERVNHELENVNLAAWKIKKSEDPGLGKFAIAFTAAGIVSSLSNEAVKFLKGKDPELWTHVES